MEVNRILWGEIKGLKVDLFTVSDSKSGFSVSVSNYGATLVSVKVPNRNGDVEEITISQDQPEDFKKYGGHLGAVIGRVANRIKDGKFSLEGKDYQLFQNNNGNSLHGGKESFDYKFWRFIESSVDEEEVIIEFEYISQDGEENYPGTLRVRAIYQISPMKLGWEFHVTTNKTTIVNMTNHTYWNLESVDVVNDNHEITLFCDRYMLADKSNMVTGEIANVEKMGVDIRKGIKFSEIYATFGDVDNNFFVSNYDSKAPTQLHKCAKLYSKKSGRMMIIKTTEPCVHLYTGNYMGGIISRGRECKKHNAICFETQRPPNAINLPEFRSMVILKPEETYTHTTQHIFSIE